jgi:hypothetical protein
VEVSPFSSTQLIKKLEQPKEQSFSESTALLLSVYDPRDINHCRAIGAADFEAMKDDASTKTTYHKDFSDPHANTVVKSVDEVSFRVHDFYLKASS